MKSEKRDVMQIVCFHSKIYSSMYSLYMEKKNNESLGKFISEEIKVKTYFSEKPYKYIYHTISCAFQTFHIVFLEHIFCIFSLSTKFNYFPCVKYVICYFKASTFFHAIAIK